MRENNQLMSRLAYFFNFERISPTAFLYVVLLGGLETCGVLGGTEEFVVEYKLSVVQTDMGTISTTRFLSSKWDKHRVQGFLVL